MRSGKTLSWSRTKAVKADPKMTAMWKWAHEDSKATCQFPTAAITNDHKIISLQFCWWEVWCGSHLPKVRVSVGLRSFLEAQGGGSDFLLIWVVGRIQFLTRIGLGSPFRCWLSAEGHFQLLEATCFLGLWLPFFIFGASKGGSKLAHSMHLFLFFFRLSLWPSQARLCF